MSKYITIGSDFLPYYLFWLLLFSCFLAGLGLGLLFGHQMGMHDLSDTLEQAGVVGSMSKLL